jgi:hypothetical protein
VLDILDAHEEGMLSVLAWVLGDIADFLSLSRACLGQKDDSIFN